MSYQAEVSRSQPGCFVFLLDQSGSMLDAFATSGTTKAQGVATAINRLLHELVLKCTKNEGVRDYYQLAVLGYGNAQVQAALGTELELVPISRVAMMPLRVEQLKRKVEDGAGGLVQETIRLPIWVDPVADGDTPMSGALDAAFEIAQRFVAAHPRSYPPIVINITDGEATDGDPTPAADRLRALGTDDGTLLLFNCHISSSAGTPVVFAASTERLPDTYSQELFRMSSRLPPAMVQAAQAEGFRVENGARGFAFNADLSDLIRFLDIGTRPAGLR